MSGFLPSSKLNSWHESYELIFSELCDEAQIRGYLHKKAYEYFYTKNLWFQIPIMMFSAISGSGNFISSSFPDIQKYIILAVGGLSIITGIISSVFQYMKVSELSEGHRLSYLSWEKFYTNIKFQLRRKDDDRENILEFINMIIPEYQRLIEISPDIPNHITRIIKKKKKEMNWIHLPFIISDFDKTTPYSSRLDEKKKQKLNSESCSNKSSETDDILPSAKRRKSQHNIRIPNDKLLDEVIELPTINVEKSTPKIVEPIKLKEIQKFQQLQTENIKIPIPNSIPTPEAKLSSLGLLGLCPNPETISSELNNLNNFTNITIDLPDSGLNLPQTISNITNINDLTSEQQQFIFSQIKNTNSRNEAISLNDINIDSTS
jgi:hypothetical protein